VGSPVWVEFYIVGSHRGLRFSLLLKNSEEKIRRPTLKPAAADVFTSLNFIIEHDQQEENTRVLMRCMALKRRKKRKRMMITIDARHL